MDDCIFCKIIKGDIPSYKVYEDSDVYVMLDINPFSKGHVLVLPKIHCENIHDIPEDTLCKVISVAKKFADRIKQELHPEGIILLQNNGARAGQSVFHFHFHVKPVFPESEVPSEGHLRKKLTEEEMLEIQKILEEDYSALK